MIIKCFRCGKKIDSPGDKNADYVIAQDTIVREPGDILLALKHNTATRAKQAKNLPIDDSEYDTPEVSNPKSARVFGKDLVKVVATVKDKDIQKTGIICTECHKPTDFLIWGVHKVSK